MRTAFVSTILHCSFGGADTLWARAAELALDRGEKILLAISPRVAAHPRVRAMQARGALLALHKPAARPPTLLAAVRHKLRRLTRTPDELTAALRAFKPDQVIFSLGGTYDLLLHPRSVEWLITSRISFQAIANWQREHPSLPEPEIAWTRTAFAAASRLVFVSRRNLEVTRRHLLAPLPNAMVLHNPLRWIAADISPWPASRTATLATVSRLDEGKGIQLLLHALATCAPTLPEWRLNIYGAGPFESVLHAIVAALRLESRVSFRGYVKELRAIWAENQLMCSPSIDDGVPMTIPEAMLCGRPVLATCVGGAEDWIDDGRSGFLCPAPTVPLLAATLQRAFQARASWPEMGAAAATTASRKYRPDDFSVLLEPPASS